MTARTPAPPTVEHQSERVHCEARQQAAVVSIIERRDEHGAMRFVLWCSLRGTDACDEACLERRRLSRAGAHR